MYPETKPIIFNCPRDYESIELFPIHDLHYGNECFNLAKWNRLHDLILSEPNRYVVWVGDLMENAIPGSKSSVFDQMYSPQEQKEYITALFKEFKHRTIAILDGNHEHNRSTRAAGLYPLYDCACIAGIPERYRTAYAVMDIGVGNDSHYMKGRQTHYVGYATHHAKTQKNFASADMLEGFDFFMYGHDHEPDDHPRAKIIYDARNHSVSFKDVEMINCGAFLRFGGYGARGGGRPKSDKLYKVILYGGEKNIETLGYHVKE